MKDIEWLKNYELSTVNYDGGLFVRHKTCASDLTNNRYGCESYDFDDMTALTMVDLLSKHETECVTEM